MRTAVVTASAALVASESVRYFAETGLGLHEGRCDRADRALEYDVERILREIFEANVERRSVRA